MTVISIILSNSTVLAVYNGSVASSYATKWAKSYNTSKYYKASLDCTNFVSQCLETGGKIRSSSLPSYESTSHWRPHSATWENATYFKKYWKPRAQAIWGRNIESFTQAQRKALSTSTPST